MVWESFQGLKISKQEECPVSLAGFAHFGCLTCIQVRLMCCIPCQRNWGRSIPANNPDVAYICKMKPRTLNHIQSMPDWIISVVLSICYFPSSQGSLQTGKTLGVLMWEIIPSQKQDMWHKAWSSRLLSRGTGDWEDAEGEKSMFLRARKSSSAQRDPCLSSIPLGPLLSLTGGGVKCWCKQCCQEKVLRSHRGISSSRCCHSSVSKRNCFALG